MSHEKTSGQSGGQNNPAFSNSDEINLLEYVYGIVDKKWWIVGLTLFGIIAGSLIAHLKGPVWVAEVVIAPQEKEERRTPNLSSFGALGGLVSSQLNIGGNASLDKISMLLESRDFNARMIETFDLLPLIYRYKWPKLYRQVWDSSANTWSKDFQKPNLLGMGSFISSVFLKKTVQENLMKIEVTSRDSAFSSLLSDCYITFLNNDIKSSVQKNARENVAYLEKQLVSINDPLLREKLQLLIADEIEKTMLVSEEAFRIIDPKYMQRRFKERKLYPAVFGVFLFSGSLLFIVLLHAFVSAEKTEKDRVLIQKIKRRIFTFK